MTLDTDVLVIGAGPAGTSAARACAVAGLRVTLVDRARFPRDKTCGDALMPDALRALRSMGVASAVAQYAFPVRELRVFPPVGPAVRLAGEFQCVPRLTLDDTLLRAAADAGVERVTGARARAPIDAGGVVHGATFIDEQGHERAIHAKTTVLATGAEPSMLEAFGMGRRVRSNAVALRRYYEVDPVFARAIDYLAISYDAQVCPGYGWIFPGPDLVFNVGVGWFAQSPPGTRGSLHTLFDRFLQSFPLARRLMDASRPLAPPRGAQVRTSLTGAHFARPGLLVAGEAAGSTYAASGEGIGKAMETGFLAAEVIVDGHRMSRSAQDIASRYARELRDRFALRFAAYDVAQQWSSRPWMLNVLSWRANRGTFVRRQLEALIAETGDPRTLFSPIGLIRAMLL